MSKKMYLVSLGCNKNLVDSEVMIAKLSDYEMCDEPSQADLLLVNTCGFIADAKEESISTIFELHEQRKEGSVLAVTGCLTQRYQQELQAEMSEVDIFSGVGDYDKIDELVEQKRSQFSDKTYLIQDEDRVITGSNYHAYIKISEGCNQSCSFCAIPNFRGGLQSRNIDTIVAEIKRLVEAGYYDFSLISQDSSSYGKDLGYKDGLIDLVDAIEQIEGVKSARILYLYPSTLTFKFIDKIQSSTIFHNYFDLPVQHISLNMLKIMKRGAKSEKLREFVSKMKEKDGFVRTSFIVGHPGETQEDFNEMCEFAKEYEFDRVNIFAYSEEENTTAALMEDKIDDDIIQQRIDTLEEIINNITEKKLKKYINKEIDVVIDGMSDESEYFLSAKALMWAPEIDWQILINDSEIEEELEYGKIYRAKITESAGDTLIATIIG
jgi:ribosomal protein S12 methylthiotransferase RimO